VIRNHVAGHFFTAEAYQRWHYYPETYYPDFGMWDHWTPTAWFDGVDEQTALVAYDEDSTRAVYRDKVTTRRMVPSPLALDLEVAYGGKNDTGTAHVEVVATDVISFEDLHLRLALVEDNASTKLIRNQVLRAYFPDTLGISFSISQGDTFDHSEDFVIDTAWVAENCKMVAFVQDDTTREVVQVVQRLVSSPVPEEVADLTVTLVGEDLLLRWSSVTVDTSGSPLEVHLYHVYRNTLPVFETNLTPLTSTTDTFYLDDSGVVGDTGINYYYAVTAVSGSKESGFSATVGEFDKDILKVKEALLDFILDKKIGMW
jgi:hypothetical protein